MIDLSQTIVSTLKGFSVAAEVAEVQQGAAVDRYALRLAPGVKVKAVTALADDIALAIGAASVRVYPIPGTRYVGIEVPAEERQTIELPEVEADHPLRFPVGMAVDGSGVSARLDKLPHLLVAGTTGSGKSVWVTATLAYLVTHAEPSGVQLMLIDPKRVEFAAFAGIRHLARPVATDIASAVETLDAAVAEMDRRWELLEAAGKKQISDLSDPPPYLIVAVDELADLIMTSGKRVESALVRLLQLGRAAGIHLILATQRPSREVLTGLITTNAPSRMVFSVQSHADSGVALGQSGAEKLLGQGDGLWFPSGASQPERIQGFYLDTDQLDDMLAPLRVDEALVEEFQSLYSEEDLERMDAARPQPGETREERDARVREAAFARLRGEEAAKSRDTFADPHIEEFDRAITAGSISTGSGIEGAERLMEAAYYKGRAHGEMLANPSYARRRPMLAGDIWLAILLAVAGTVAGFIALPVLPLAAGAWLTYTVSRRRTRIDYNMRGMTR